MIYNNVRQNAIDSHRMVNNILTPHFQILKLTELAILLNQVHLGEDVYMGKLHVQHGRQRRAQHRDELGWVCTVVRIHKVD